MHSRHLSKSRSVTLEIEHFFDQKKGKQQFLQPAHHSAARRDLGFTHKRHFAVLPRCLRKRAAAQFCHPASDLRRRGSSGLVRFVCRGSQWKARIGEVPASNSIMTFSMLCRSGRWVSGVLEEIDSVQAWVPCALEMVLDRRTTWCNASSADAVVLVAAD